MVKARAPKSRTATKRSASATLEGATLRLGERIVPLRSGAVHYWRLRPESWGDALDQIVALGLPMVESYVPWAVHEVDEGRYDFGETDPRKNLGRFLDLAEERELVVFLRPGPHINAEMTYFGLPSRVVHDPDCQARSPRGNPVILYFPPRMFPVPSHASEAYHEELGGWYDAVAEVIAPRIWPKGPVALLQVDNEASYFFRNGPFCQDYHDDAIAEWHSFLEKRYGDLRKVADAHARTYPSWNEVSAPTRFAGDRNHPGELVRQLDWAAFHEHLITQAMGRMKRRMRKAGLKGTPVVHNVSLGDGGLPVNVPALNREVDLVGFDYYHPAREHRTIKRRTSYLAGTLDTPYAPELGIGSPPWFTPMSHHDSLYTAMTACAFGLRGFNLYMAVDRDRWYGTPIDATGHPRAEASEWKRFVGALSRTRFHELRRDARVALVMPREYQRLARATHLLGPVSSATLEALGGTPIDGCRSDDLGFDEAVQLGWWKLLARMADALTAAGVPYVYVDSEAPVRMLEGHRVVFAPAYEWADPDRWHKLQRVAQRGAHVVYGPTLPKLDMQLRPFAFEPPKGEAATLIDDAQAHALVHDWIGRFELERPYATLPPIETALHRDGERDAVLFVMNPTDAAAAAHIPLPKPTLARDLLSDEVFEGDDELRMRVAPRTCRMLSLEDPKSSKAPRARAKEGPT